MRNKVSHVIDFDDKIIIETNSPCDIRIQGEVFFKRKLAFLRK